MQHLLNWILWTPVLGIIGIFLIPAKAHNTIRFWSLFVTATTLVLTVLLYCQFDQTTPGMQEYFNIKFPWIEQFHINYFLGVDGISLPMILLTGLLFFLCILSSWTIEKSVKSYFALFLMLEASVFGVFMALDFFLFYVFWEVMLIPMFFLIGVWGGENREYAAVKFFLYTFAGSVLMLVGLIALYFASGSSSESFNILALQGG